MKAYRVTNKKHREGSCLAFAASPEQARALTQVHFGYMLGSTYIDWRAVRFPDYDRYAPDAACIIPTDDDMPPGAPAYYDTI